MAYSTPPTWATGEVVTAARLQILSDDTTDLDRRTTGHSGTVATAQTTSSVAFTDLATQGPSATATIGTTGTALVILTANMGNDTAGAYALMGFQVGGATSINATDAQSLSINYPANPQFSATYLVTGLTAGSNTFTAKYRATGGNASFMNRNIVVIPLGS